MNIFVSKLLSKIRYTVAPVINAINNPITYFKACIVYKLPMGKNRQYCIQGKLIKAGHVQVGEFVSITVEKGGKLILGNNVGIGYFGRIYVGKGHTMKIGDDTSLNSFNILIGDISIGEKCLFAPYVYLSSGKHHIVGRTYIKDADTNYLIDNQGKGFSAPIVVGDDCWIGISSVVMHGCYINRGCVVGANSVVTAGKKLEEYEIWGGVPAKYISCRE